MKSVKFFALCLGLCLTLCQETSLIDFSPKATVSISSKETFSGMNLGEMYACPRCRRATPPGPRKRPANQNPGTQCLKMC
jgi:hypothetical protein